jgi:protein-L-isoaspartate(D-aspartate) O-methyltransferase
LFLTKRSEPFEKTAVRELAEETGLIADPGDVRVLSLLWDDNAGVACLNAVARVAAWCDTLRCREEGSVRWEWFDLHTVVRLDRLFTPSAHALNAVWPGIIPGLPPARAYPHAVVHPRVDGEPAVAMRLRQQMAEVVIAGGWAPSPAVQQPPGGAPPPLHPGKPPADRVRRRPLTVTRRDDAGRATSSVSAPWLQADMRGKRGTTCPVVGGL